MCKLTVPLSYWLEVITLQDLTDKLALLTGTSIPDLGSTALSSVIWNLVQNMSGSTTL